MKIICIGRNYADHISELANQRPDEPVVFIKPDSSVLPDEQPFVIPPFSDNVHHEVELVVKINKAGKHIQPEFAGTYYDEIGLGIDFTARDVQDKLKAKGLPWEKAKGFDGATVIGKFLPKTQLTSVDEITFRLEKNGNPVQQGNSALMLWQINELICHVSTYFTLRKGDLIFTGTPAGVSKVDSGDVLEGFINNQSMFKTSVL